MKDRLLETKTVVGIPFYDGESVEVLEACLQNVDKCLNGLDIDAKIVVGVNGPSVSQGKQPLSYVIDRSKYNADIKFIKTPPGLVNSTRTIAKQAEVEGHKRIFLTDADISRFPLSLHNLWENGDKQINGCNYSTYPIEILIGSGLTFSKNEIAFMKVFEADKHPLAREFTTQYRPIERLKGSLLLLDTDVVQAMYGYQNITSDSRMNHIIPKDARKAVDTACFMHYARIDIVDHIKARLRHFRAARATGDLQTFSKKSLIYEKKIADQIANNILAKYPEAHEVASNFLLQTALRYKVAEICTNIALGNKHEFKPDNPQSEVDFVRPVKNFAEAYGRMSTFLNGIDWNCLNGAVSNGNGTTQNEQRIPIDLEPFLKSNKHREIIFSHLGLRKDANV